MKYLILIGMIIINPLMSMQQPTAQDQQREAAQTAIHLRDAGLLIPDRILFQMHPNVRAYWHTYNQKLTELYQKHKK